MTTDWWLANSCNCVCMPCFTSTKRLQFVGFLLRRSHNHQSLASCREAHELIRFNAASQCSDTGAETKCSTDDHGAESMLARTHRHLAGQRQRAIDFCCQVNICVCMKTHQKQLQLSRTVTVVANKTLYIHNKAHVHVPNVSLLEADGPWADVNVGATTCA